MSDTVTAEGQLPISVVICSLNEEDNIERCVKSVLANNPAEVLVIDCGSKDNTVALARTAGATHVEVCEKKGLAYQRYLGVELAKHPYIAFIDADDKLEPDAMAVSLREMDKFGWKAIGMQTGPLEPETYWERAMGFLDTEYHNSPGPTIMVGRPALYERETLVNVGIDKDWGMGIGDEDTDLSIRFEKAGVPMGIGTARSLRKHPASLRASMKTWIKYGKGDAKISCKHPEKKKNMLGQVYRKYFGVMSWFAIRRFRFDFLPFIWLMGLTRFFVALNYLDKFPEYSRK